MYIRHFQYNRIRTEFISASQKTNSNDNNNNNKTASVSLGSETYAAGK
jgi:hypothetical protein